MPKPPSTEELLDFHIEKLPNEKANDYTKRCKERYNRVRARIKEIRNANQRTNHDNVKALYQKEIDRLESFESTLNGRINRPWHEH